MNFLSLNLIEIIDKVIKQTILSIIRQISLAEAVNIKSNIGPKVIGLN